MNRYAPGSRLTLHQNKNERALEAVHPQTGAHRFNLTLRRAG
ncbi:hypothetical protein AKJ09_04586 [Labilithrix luteola]|uniref:Uncharacterized protein n=1 Tax=Labilithrix luteola TaxID=1391654 RepID=A0A0K1PWM9_9BACT|nr:hypothetical protein AKJ09_04586 [Labilithrix luteola]